MYERKVGKAYGRGCLLQLAVGTLGGLLGLLMLATVLWIIQGGRVEPRSPRVALALAVPIAVLSVPIGFGCLLVWRRGRRLDRAFAPWALEGRQSGGTLRGWHGEVDGRRLDAWFHRGPTLELYLDCRPACRGVVHRGGRLIRGLTRAIEQREPLDPPPFELAGASFYATDPEWLRRLLRRREAESAVRALLRETPRAAAAVFFAPGAVRYMRRFMPVSEVHPDNLRLWLGELGRLAAAVDAEGPASEAAEPTRLETWARTRRGQALRRILLGLGVFFVAVMTALYLFAFWNVGRP